MDKVLTAINMEIQEEEKSNCEHGVGYDTDCEECNKEKEILEHLLIETTDAFSGLCSNCFEEAIIKSTTSINPMCLKCHEKNIIESKFAIELIKKHNHENKI